MPPQLETVGIWRKDKTLIVGTTEILTGPGVFFLWRIESPKTTQN